MKFQALDRVRYINSDGWIINGSIGTVDYIDPQHDCPVWVRFEDRDAPFGCYESSLEIVERFDLDYDIDVG